MFNFFFQVVVAESRFVLSDLISMRANNFIAFIYNVSGFFFFCISGWSYLSILPKLIPTLPILPYQTNPIL